MPGPSSRGMNEGFNRAKHKEKQTQLLSHWVRNTFTHRSTAEIAVLLTVLQAAPIRPCAVSFRTNESGGSADLKEFVPTNGSSFLGTHVHWLTRARQRLFSVH
jgi:hypothetical protein